MSTDLYGVRVLEVAPREPRVRFRVYVVYYDTAARYANPIPDDPSFFVQELWRAAKNAPLTSLHPLWRVTVEQICDEGWLARNTHRFVRSMEVVSTRNHPVAEDAWPKLHDFHYERDGRWRDEHLLAQADIDVIVTDPRWLEPLRPGQGWGTTSYAVVSDRIPEPGDTTIHLGSPALVLTPFPEGFDDAATPSDAAMSDDGRYLAVTNQDGELVVFRTEDWSEHLRLPESPLWGQDIRWIPGTHKLAGRVIDGEPDPGPGRAFDVDTGAEAEGAPQVRETPPLLRTREGRRLLDEVVALAHYHSFSPGQEYLVAADEEELTLWRVDDGALLMRHHTGGEIFRAFAWSPDRRTLVASVVTGRHGYGGEFRVYRAARHEETEPTVEELREYAEDADGPDKVFLLGLLAEREDDADEQARIHRERGKALWGDDLPAAAEALRLSVALGGTTNAMHASFDLALTLRALKDTDGAIEAARTAHRISDARDIKRKKDRRQLGRTCLLLADLLRNRGDREGVEEARGLYERAVELGVEKVGWATMCLGWIAYDEGDLDAAEPPLLRAVELSASEPHTLGWASMLLGCVAKDRRDVPGALRWFTRAMKTDDGRRGLATGHLGELYYLLGERAEAVKWYRKTVKAAEEPELLAEACFRIGEIVAAEGDLPQARALLRKAVESGDEKFGARARELLDGLAA